jgi:uncharacterized protein YxeA
MEEEENELQDEEVKEDVATPDAPKFSSEPAVGRRDRRKQPKVNKKILLIIVIIILIVLGGVFLLKEPKLEVEPIPKENLSQEVKEEPAPTATSTPINKKDIKIEVLNGTGIAKAAAFLQEELNKLGYSNIDVGNVGDEKFTESEVTFSRTIDSQIRDEIKEKLEELYQEVTVKEGSLDDFDIRIIAGLRKGQVLPTDTPTPTPTKVTSPTPTATSSATPTP